MKTNKLDTKFNVMMTLKMRATAKAKAEGLEISLSQVVRIFLQRWLEDKIEV